MKKWIEGRDRSDAQIEQSGQCKSRVGEKIERWVLGCSPSQLVHSNVHAPDNTRTSLEADDHRRSQRPLLSEEKDGLVLVLVANGPEDRNDVERHGQGLLGEQHVRSAQGIKSGKCRRNVLLKSRSVEDRARVCRGVRPKEFEWRLDVEPGRCGPGRRAEV